MGHISLKTEKRLVVTLRLKGSGTAEVNWGDGTPVKKIELSALGEEVKSASYDGRRTITIEGKDITYLRCTDNLLTDLDVSRNPELEVLRCRDNKLQKLNISNLSRLTILSCSLNKIENLDVSNNTQLVELRCSDNRLLYLDVTNLRDLQTLVCHNNYGLQVVGGVDASSAPTVTISEDTQGNICINSIVVMKQEDGVKDIIIDGQKFPKLKDLNCNGTSVTSLTVRNCPALTNVVCDNNSDLRNIHLGSHSELKNMIVTNNSLLTDFKFDYEDFPKLEQLDLSGNRLDNLNLSDFAKLTNLNLRGNGLKNLFIGGCRNLRTLNCSGNNLSELSIDLNEEGNPNFPKLTTLYCGYNLLSETALNNIFEGLPQIDNKIIAELTIRGNLGAETCNKEIAENKNWKIEPPLRLVAGNEKVLPDEDVHHELVNSVLGKGYDISLDYAKTQNKGAVLDLDKLNKNKRLRKYTGKRGEGISVSSEGRKTYSKEVETKLNIDIGASLYGVSFKNETEEGFKKEETNDETNKYLMKNATHEMENYSITGIKEPDNILGALSDDFLMSLETLSGRQIIENYGTHVIGGMVLGTALRYYMKYQKNVSTMTQTKTFSQKCEVGYGGGNTKDNDAKKANDEAKDKNSKLPQSTKSVGDIISDFIKDGFSLKPIKEAINLLQTVSKKSETEKEKDKEKDKKAIEEKVDAIGGASFSASVAVAYTESETTNTSEEMTQMEVRCMLIGGDVTQTMSIMSDPSFENADEWLNSTKTKENWAWIDFMPDTIIPIWKFVPLNHSKYDEIKKAWSDDLTSKGLKFGDLIPQDAIIECDFETRRLPNQTVFCNAGDWEMMSKAGRNPSYTLSFELVNIDGGKAGVDVILTLMENYGDGTNLEVHELIPLDHNSLGFDKIIVHPSYAQLDTSYKIPNKVIGTSSDMNEWWDATEEARGKKIGFYQDSNGKCYGCLDLSTPLRFQFDGKGSDGYNIGIKGKFKVKVLGFKRK
jgi:Leucine-rich repeat (LRR) protein